MTNIFISKVIQEIPCKKMDMLRYYFNETVIDKIDKAPHYSYRLKRATSRLMLIQVFKQLGIHPKKLKEIYYNKHGKLMVDNMGCNISLSYSTDIAVCLTSSHRLGMDVEDTRVQPKAHCTDMLEKLTKKSIQNKMDFYTLWTQIESIVKLYDNKGLSDIFFGNLLSEKHYTKQCFYNQEYLISTSSINQLDYLTHIKLLNV